MFYSFFLLLLRPPVSTLFPYTTLFRSSVRSRPSSKSASTRDAALWPAMPSIPPAGAHADEDRKSTRLNSSHVEISYAVFCLKKQNKPKLKTKPHVLQDMRN